MTFVQWVEKLAYLLCIFSINKLEYDATVAAMLKVPEARASYESGITPTAALLQVLNFLDSLNTTQP